MIDQEDTIREPISVETFLNTSWEPNIDYVDGKLEERHSGTMTHSRLHGQLGYLLARQDNEWGVLALSSLQLQTSPTRFLKPDVAVLRRDNPHVSPSVEPPLLCLEVLCELDGWARMERRLRDYAGMGVPETWLFDPETRTAFVVRADGVRFQKHEGVLELPNTAVRLDVAEVFAVLDEE